MLIGRDSELGQIAALLDEARRGRSGQLAIVGEPGVGKTALLEDVLHRTGGMRLLTATGVETEAELPFALLHELVRPLLELLPRIPAAQAHGLAAALALEEGEPDLLAVGAATLSLLVEAAEEMPVLVVLDDVQWLDDASAAALVFAARRLRMEQLAVLAAFRLGARSAFDAFPRLDLEPLPPDEARRLLRSRPKPVGVADEAAVLAVAAGNPLALLELPAGLARDLPASATTSHDRLRRTFAQRVEALPRATQLGLLLAAAEPDPGVVRRAGESLQLEDPLGPAEAAGLVRVHDGSLTFRHPVVRSLVYANAPAADRTLAHQALAGCLLGEADGDRRAWHLAAAADAPDEEIAALLEETAERAIARGGHAAAARALERAARLSPTRTGRARRLSLAFRSQRYSGNTSKTLALADELLSLTDDPLERADLLFHVRSANQWLGGRIDEAVLLNELERTEGLDDERRAKLLLLVIGHRKDEWDAAGAAELAPRLEHFGRGTGPIWHAQMIGAAADAHLLAGDRERAIRLYREVAARPSFPTMAAFQFMTLEWHDDLRSSLAETLREARSGGFLWRIAWNRTCAAHLELRHGRLGAAEAAAAEAIELGDILADPKIDLAASALAGVQAWRGQAKLCTANARRAAASARTARDLYSEGLARNALGLLALATKRPADAIVELEPLARRWVASTVADPVTVAFIPDLVEAYAQTGATANARALQDRFARIAAAAGNTAMLAAAERCEGLLAPAGEFDARFLSALELLAESPYVLELARTRLAYGERLRRTRRPGDARTQLQAAFEAFAGAGATPWQELAAVELRAAGGTVSSPHRPRADLTPQEIHIATLVAEGKANKEIAAALYLSPKTIEYHLANTYRKLDIHTRAELARIVTQHGAP